MATSAIKGCYRNGAHSVAIEMEDGSMFYVNGLGCGEAAGEVSYAPDGWHYPAPSDGRGKRAQGPFTCHTPPELRG